MDKGTQRTAGAYRALGLAVCTIVLTISPGGIAAGAETTTPIGRVRSSDWRLTSLIDQATQRSPTFRRLLAAIQASSGIVYAEPGPCGHGVRACLKMWMHVSGPNRFVRILIQQSSSDTDQEVTAALGHELQHAIEVLAAPEVRDGVTMFSYLKRTAPTDNNRFETTAAINAGNAVYDELRRAK
jgi:hypothetical protein